MFKLIRIEDGEEQEVGQFVDREEADFILEVNSGQAENLGLPVTFKVVEA